MAEFHRVWSSLERILLGKVVLCLCLASILLTSIFLPEMNVSLRNAYAEESTNQSSTAIVNSTDTNSTSIQLTESIVANQNSTSVTNGTGTNSTDLVAAMQNSTAIVNTTITYYTSVPLSESVDSVDQNLTSITNSTKADSIDSVLTDSLSNVIPSWQFSSTSNSSANTTAKKNPAAQNTISSEPISSGYLQESVDDTNKLSALSISTWVKPDYSQGSPEFTVISKYNSFILSINNIIPATQVAKFSIFNGIKWYTVQSVTQIPQQWTHLVSTFNGTAICMYVNEKAESCNPLPETIISIRGDLTTTRLNNLTSDSNVVIGAYVNPIRESVSNQFNGLVDSVLLYNSTLQPSQVTEIFNENKQKYLDHNDQDALNFSQP